jgi:hypothetical protein
MLATLIDFIHALTMLAWFVGLPLLVWRKYPRLTRAYALYALAFVVLSQLSYWVLGECFLTTMARTAWESQPVGTAPPDVEEWFTVRIARGVFGATPSHRSIVWLSEAAVVVTAALALRSLRPPRPRHRASSATAS